MARKSTKLYFPLSSLVFRYLFIPMAVIERSRYIPSTSQYPKCSLIQDWIRAKPGSGNSILVSLTNDRLKFVGHSVLPSIHISRKLNHYQSSRTRHSTPVFHASITSSGFIYCITKSDIQFLTPRDPLHIPRSIMKPLPTNSHTSSSFLPWATFTMAVYSTPRELNT